VFHFAGPELLPVLYRSLDSNELKVRANAVEACGAIGDEASLLRIDAREVPSGGEEPNIVLGEKGLTDRVVNLLESVICSCFTVAGSGSEPVPVLDFAGFRVG
jgi:HEAT repeat protein